MLFASLQDRMELGTMEGRRAREDGGYWQEDTAAATWGGGGGTGRAALRWTPSEPACLGLCASKDLCLLRTPMGPDPSALLPGPTGCLHSPVSQHHALHPPACALGDVGV